MVDKFINLRYQCDVPVSIALSGGVDSSVVAVAGSRYSHDIKAFTVQPTDLSLNTSSDTYYRHTASSAGLREYQAANFICDSFDLDHQLISVIQMTCLLTILSVLLNLVTLQPLVSAYKMYKTISSSYRVCLEGQGADEIYGGYFNMSAPLAVIDSLL